MSGLAYELRSWAMLVEGTGGLNRTEVMRKAADRIVELEEALEACLPYMKYPRDASDALVLGHDKALARARAVLAPAEAAPTRAKIGHAHKWEPAEELGPGVVSCDCGFSKWPT